jgi:RNA polymerase sigma-70 factor (ECF subfamily)
MVLIQDGDHRAFDKLYERYAHRLNGFFYKMLWSNREMAEDQVHDLFTRIIDRPELYKKGYDVKPWLFRIASNMCKNAYRKRSFENTYRAQLEDQQIILSSVERKLDEGIQSGMLHEALDKLDEDRRSMFLLRYQQELSLKEIAVIFDLPEGTVKSRIFYIKKLLAGAIEDDQNILKDGK